MMRRLRGINNNKRIRRVTRILLCLSWFFTVVFAFSMGSYFFSAFDDKSTYQPDRHHFYQNCENTSSFTTTSNELSKERAFVDRSGTETTNRAIDNKSSRPWHILQYGERRTATTFQFQTLCSCMFVKLYSQGTDTDDYSMVKKFSCTFANETKQWFQPDEPRVVKAHRLRRIPKPPKDMWFFATGTKADISHHQSVGFDNVKYIQEQSKLNRLGHYMVYEYQDIFGLTDSQMEQILEYMRYWEILRKCCGVQMSQDWRFALLPNELRKKRKFYSGGRTKHHDVHSPLYHACRLYDIDQVEQHYLNTTIVRAMMKFPNMHRSIKPALRDNELDGTYCSRYNRAVQTMGLGFNEQLPTN